MIKIGGNFLFCLSSRHEHGSGLKPILSGSGLDRAAIFLKIGGSGLDLTEKTFCFNVIILNTSKRLAVIQFHRFAKWQCIFYHQWQKLCWDHFAIRTLSTGFRYKFWV